MSHFSVHHQQLIDAAVTTSRVSDELTRAQARLGSRAKALVASGWTGPAARGFDEAMREWDTGATEVLDALGRMGELLAQANRRFTQSDDRGRAMLTTAGGQLPSGLKV